MKFLRTMAAMTLVAAGFACASQAPAPEAEEQAPAVSQEEMDAQHEAANLQLVSDWWRTVIQARHVEMAPMYQAASYIQHNPNIDTGRDAFVAIFGRREPVNPIPETLTPAPVVQFAKGDYVVFMWERQGMDDDNQPYTYNFFDLVRVENGMVAEHWDSVFKNSEMTVDTGKGPRPVAPPNTPEEQAAEDIANHEFKDILQYGHVEMAPEYMAEGYIQHNPNVPTGRDGFVEFFSRFAQPEPIEDAWKDEPELILTSGNLVFYMMRRFSDDPANPGTAYKWNWFDMVRVDDGLVQEHWDMATKGQAPASVPRPADFVEYTN